MTGDKTQDDPATPVAGRPGEILYPHAVAPLPATSPFFGVGCDHSVIGGTKRSFTVLLPRPPSANALYANARGKGRVKTDAANTYYWLAHLDLVGKRPRPITGKIRVLYECGRIPDRRRRDLANYEKILSDFMVATGLIEGDYLIEEITLRWVDNIAGVRATVEEA